MQLFTESGGTRVPAVACTLPGLAAGVRGKIMPAWVKLEHRLVNLIVATSRVTRVDHAWGNLTGWLSAPEKNRTDVTIDQGHSYMRQPTEGF